MKQFLTSRFYLLFIFLSLFLLSCNTSDNRVSKTIATINYDYSGCFSSGKSRIVIYKVDTSIMADLENESRKQIAKAKLNATQLDSFNLFIKELKQLEQNGLCTTVSHYSVVLKNESIERTDNGCEWNGFEKLSQCLFRNAFYPVNL